MLTLGLSENEMACPCCGKVVAHPALLKAYGAFRAKLGKPLKIFSGYRCKAHNAEIGGADNSQHLYGKALDIGCDAIDLETSLVYRQLALAGFRGIGHGDGVFHIDVRDDPYGWRYTPEGTEVDSDLNKLLHLMNGETP